MKTVNMHEAKTHLSRLVQEAFAGEPFIIARSGKPLVKVMPIEEEPKKKRKLGFMVGEMTVPEGYFDPASDREIEELFYADSSTFMEPFESVADVEKRHG